MTDNEKERFPWVDEEGHVLGKITRGEAHHGSMKLHPVVHLHLMNSRGELFLQKRPHWKDIQPDRWDTACGGHVDYGETIEDALRREVKEELGVTDFEPKFLLRYVFTSQRERELVHVHQTVYDGEVDWSREELADGRFWTFSEIETSLGKGVFTPNFEQEFQRIKGFLKLT